MGHYLSTSSSSETLDSSQPIPDPSTKENNNITKNPSKIDNIAKNPQEMEAKDNITKNPQETKTNGPEQEEERVANGDEEEEEEEEGECGFCLFMKGGGCKDSFVAWEKCIEEAEKNKEDIVDKCFEVTGALKKCMEVHTDYYAPILQAEKAAEAELEREIEKEGSEASSTNVPDPDNVKVVQKD